MKILVIGGGGREHAMVWKLAQSPSVEKVWCAPGNDGISEMVECLPLDVKDVRAAAELAGRLGADLTISGPELPLTLGIADEFERLNLTLLGPGRDAARLEGSKIFAKQFMERHGIPTAAVYGICDSAAAARSAIESGEWPVVLKADGLCAGKGVLVTSSATEATEFVERAMERREFGDAGERMLIEEGLPGEELSYIVLTDGVDFLRMAPARDHKRAFDDDRGPNTGGMGVYSTDEILPPSLEARIIENIVEPTLAGLREEGMRYRGFLYFGLMLTPDEPKVLEYNCRLGDPETEAVLLRADFDFAEACSLAARGRLGDFPARWSAGAAVCVVIASKGYPGNPETGKAVTGLREAARVPGAVVFHAGTRRVDQVWQTSGGRVLVVSAKGDTLAAARATAYAAIEKIHAEGAHYRRDIGAKAATSQTAAHARGG